MTPKRLPEGVSKRSELAALYGHDNEESLRLMKKGVKRIRAALRAHEYGQWMHIQFGPFQDALDIAQRFPFTMPTIKWTDGMVTNCLKDSTWKVFQSEYSIELPLPKFLGLTRNAVEKLKGELHE